MRIFVHQSMKTADVSFVYVKHSAQGGPHRACVQLMVAVSVNAGEQRLKLCL